MNKTPYTNHNHDPLLPDALNDPLVASMARALDTLALADRAAARPDMAQRVALASMPKVHSDMQDSTQAQTQAQTQAPAPISFVHNSYPLPRTPLAQRAWFALAAMVVLVVSAALVSITISPSTSKTQLADNTSNSTDSNPTTPRLADSTRADPTRARENQLATVVASPEVESWLSVATEMDAMWSVGLADISASATDLEERAQTTFAADQWISETSIDNDAI